jgi:hypothetical protein
MQVKLQISTVQTSLAGLLFLVTASVAALAVYFLGVLSHYARISDIQRRGPTTSAAAVHEYIMSNVYPRVTDQGETDTPVVYDTAIPIKNQHHLFSMCHSAGNVGRKEERVVRQF